MVKFDQSDVQTTLTVVSMQEMFFKTVMNLADITTVKKCERTVKQEDRHRFFEARRKRKSQPLSFELHIADLYLQVYASSKQRSEEILKVRLG